MPDRVTRVAADLMDDAAAEGARNSRSAKQQLDHWARVGRNLCVHQSAAKARIDAAVAGTVSLRDLTPDERDAANAVVNANIEQAARRTSFGDLLAARGVTTVAVDEDGVLRWYHPDGTSTPLDAQG